MNTVFYPSGTTAHVGISLYGVSKSGARHLRSDGAFQRGGLDMFHLETDESLGEVWKIRIWHDNTGRWSFPKYQLIKKMLKWTYRAKCTF